MSGNHLNTIAYITLSLFLYGNENGQAHIKKQESTLMAKPTWVNKLILNKRKRGLGLRWGEIAFWPLLTREQLHDQLRKFVFRSKPDFTSEKNRLTEIMTWNEERFEAQTFSHGEGDWIIAQKKEGYVIIVRSYFYEIDVLLNYW